MEKLKIITETAPLILQNWSSGMILITLPYIIMSPPQQGSGDILCFPLRLSVCVFVCLSVTKSCPLYNLITVTDISTKLHTFVKHIETMCHAQEP